MSKAAWTTDIHLNFLENPEIMTVMQKWDQQDFDYLLISGDIAQGNSILRHLSYIRDGINRPVFFVLGNHDYYRSSIESVNTEVRRWCARQNNMHFLGNEEVIPLTENTGLIGAGGWTDGRLGDFIRSTVYLNDYNLIDEFISARKENRLKLLNELGDHFAAYFKKILPIALKQFREVILLTHVPPFKEAALYGGKICDDDYLPHFSCKAVGEVLLEIMNDNPDKNLTVLCGHTHGGNSHDNHPKLKKYAGVSISKNIYVKTGTAKYGNPEINEIFDMI